MIMHSLLIMYLGTVMALVRVVSGHLIIIDGFYLH